MPHDKLIRMANQIATFCVSDPDASRRPAALAEHINKFWEPRMRVRLLDLVEGGAAGLHPLVVEAAPAIGRPLPAGRDDLIMAKNSP